MILPSFPHSFLTRQESNWKKSTKRYIKANAWYQRLRKSRNQSWERGESPFSTRRSWWICRKLSMERPKMVSLICKTKVKKYDLAFFIGFYSYTNQNPLLSQEVLLTFIQIKLYSSEFLIFWWKVRFYSEIYLEVWQLIN